MDTALLSPEVRDYIDNLENRLGILTENFETMSTDFSSLSTDYKTLEEKYQLLLFLRYGRKSEKDIPGQPELFADPEDQKSQEQAEPDTETVPACTRKKPAR